MTPALGGTQKRKQNKIGRIANLPVLVSWEFFEECDLQVFAREWLAPCLLKKLEWRIAK